MNGNESSKILRQVCFRNIMKDTTDADKVKPDAKKLRDETAENNCNHGKNKGSIRSKSLNDCCYGHRRVEQCGYVSTTGYYQNS